MKGGRPATKIRRQKGRWHLYTTGPKGGRFRKLGDFATEGEALKQQTTVLLSKLRQTRAAVPPQEKSDADQA